MWTNRSEDISKILDAAKDEIYAPDVHKTWEVTVQSALKILYREESILWKIGSILSQNSFDPSLQVDVLNKVRPEIIKQEAENDPYYENPDLNAA